MEQKIEVEAFKEFEHEGWEHAVSVYSSHFGPLTQQVVSPLLDQVAAGPGQRLLDVASGPGYVAARAWERGCTVCGLDISEAMVAEARALHPRGIAFAVGDAEALPFRDGEFDVVTMNFGILHLAQPEKAAREAGRVLKPGGRFGFTVWSPPAESIGFQLVLRAIETHGSPAVRLPQGPPFFRYSTREQGIGLLTDAGLENPAAHLLPLRWKLFRAEALFEAFYAGTARTGGNLRAQPEENRRRIEEAVRAATKTYERDGALELPMSAWLYVGEKR